MAQLEQCQRQRKAFLDRHRKGLEKELTIGKPVLLFQTRLGAMTGKLRFRWTSPLWIIDKFNETFRLGTLLRLPAYTTNDKTLFMKIKTK